MMEHEDPPWDDIEVEAVWDSWQASRGARILHRELGDG
jgi:hypothetical protein